MSTGPGPRSAPRSDPRPLGARRLAGATLVLALLTGSPGALAAAPPAYRASRPRGPRQRGPLGCARHHLLGGRAPAHRPGLAHLLGQSGRLRRADDDRVAAPAGVQRRAPRLAASSPHPRRPGDELRLHGRGGAPRPDHGARRAHARHVGDAPGAGELARVREDLHPRGGPGLADAARRPRVAPTPPAPRCSPAPGGRCPCRAPGPSSFATTPETVTFTVPAPGLSAGAHRGRLVLPAALGGHRARRGPDGRHHRRRAVPPDDARRAARGDGARRSTASS